MIKFFQKSSLLFIALVGSWISQPLLAADGQFYIAPGVQWMNFNNSTDLNNEEGYFIGVGYQFNDRWAAELSSFDLDPRSRTAGHVEIDHYKVDLLYTLDLKIFDFDTFIVGGMGNTNFGGENDTLLDYGAGISYDITDNLSWRTTARSFNYFGRDHEDSDYGIETALVYRFGNRSQPVVAAPVPVREAPPADSDGDGVPDNRDQCPDTPRNYAVDANGCPIPVEEVARLELLVNFDFDRSEVKPEYFSEIQRVADFMQQYPDVVVELEGHTDSVGTEAYNQGLSTRRANAVMDVLTGRFNVQQSRISAAGYGESRPVASNDTVAGRDQNRRVISVIIKTLQSYQPR
jgi:OOP family OmpA-OmpF porin